MGWSQGVGGGLVVNGQLVRGAHGTAGEIGHTSCDPEGKPCHCGGRGCLEGLIGLPALLAACADRGVAVADAEEMIVLAAKGRPAVADVFRDVAVTAGRVLAALAAQVDPECIVVCGEPAALDELVLAPIREQLAALSLPAAPRTVEVRGSALGGDAAALGGGGPAAAHHRAGTGRAARRAARPRRRTRRTPRPPPRSRMYRPVPRRRISPSPYAGRPMSCGAWSSSRAALS
ncbi:ROK family protein [Streptomyces sp. CLV115]|uniref:ROK family protein n=1 Tax=Streptomyces sp. CLV115 TaxID=3138502 RepID=UPI00313D79E2